MRLRIALFTVLLFAATSAFAAIRFNGKIIDPQGDPILGAEIEIVDVGGAAFTLKAKTNKKGRYAAFSHIPSAQQLVVIHIRAEGYRPFREELNLSLEEYGSINTVVQRDFTLTPLTAVAATFDYCQTFRTVVDEIRQRHGEEQLPARQRQLNFEVALDFANCCLKTDQTADLRQPLTEISSPLTAAYLETGDEELAELSRELGEPLGTRATQRLAWIRTMDQIIDLATLD